MNKPFTTTGEGYTRSGVECGCALLYNLALGTPTLHPCGEEHRRLLEGGGRTSYVSNRDERPDSFEIGTPGGAQGHLKLYFDAANPEEAHRLLEAAQEIRRLALAPREERRSREETNEVPLRSL